MKKKVPVLIMFIVFASYAYGGDWYVRPARGSYGSENGTSYQNAWDGLLSVVWGVRGRQAGRYSVGLRTSHPQCDLSDSH